MTFPARLTQKELQALRWGFHFGNPEMWHFRIARGRRGVIAARDVVRMAHRPK